MSIELHCPKCGKLIRAPDNAGGRHGKCPYCSASVYVPTPPSDDELIPIAPVDEKEVQREEAERRESARLAAMFDHISEGTGGPGPRSGGSPGRTGSGPRRPESSPGEVIDLAAETSRYVLAMRDSKLDEAESATVQIRKTGSRGRDYVEGLLLDELPPTFEGVPPPLVQGFLKSLLARLG